MTPQEQTMLSDLIGRVESTRLPEKDAEAEELMKNDGAKSGCAVHPGADGAGAELRAGAGQGTDRTLKRQLAQLRRSRSQPRPRAFWGTCSGIKMKARAPQRRARRYAPAQQQAILIRTAAHRQYGHRRYPPPAAQGGGGSSFLRTAATTAAGVAAGALAFEGIESLMHGFGNSAGFGGDGGYGRSRPGGRPGETVINNYYDSPAPGSDDRSADIQQYAHEGDSGLNTQQDLASDVNVDDDGGQLQADTDLPSLDDDSGSFDDASLDDSGSFDDSSFDNS